MNRLDRIGENGVFTGAALLADYAYDALSRRTGLARGTGLASTYGYDIASRLTSLAHDLEGAGTANDQTLGFLYNPASQIRQRSAANDNYNWTAASLDHAYVRNGLNQYETVGGADIDNDARGNLIDDNSRAFCYDLENRLIRVAAANNPTCASPSLTISYDPLGRLRQTADGATTTDFLYDGDRLVAEYNGGALLRRYVHGAGVDEPLAWYEGTGTSDRRYLIADTRARSSPPLARAFSAIAMVRTASPMRGPADASATPARSCSIQI